MVKELKDQLEYDHRWNPHIVYNNQTINYINGLIKQHHLSYILTYCDAKLTYLEGL